HALLLDDLVRGVRRLRASRRISLARGHRRGILRAHAPAPVRRASERPAPARSSARAAPFPRVYVPSTSAGVAAAMDGAVTRRIPGGAGAALAAPARIRRRVRT